MIQASISFEYKNIPITIETEIENVEKFEINDVAKVLAKFMVFIDALEKPSCRDKMLEAKQ